MGEIQCARGDCTTCEQGAEKLPPCNKSNLLYENICADCNPGALKKGELENVQEEAPSSYVGETSRMIFEGSKEHWGGARAKTMKCHMHIHQTLEHIGRKMKLVNFFKSPLTR